MSNYFPSTEARATILLTRPPKSLDLDDPGNQVVSSSKSVSDPLSVREHFQASIAMLNKKIRCVVDLLQFWQILNVSVKMDSMDISDGGCKLLIGA